MKAIIEKYGVDNYVVIFPEDDCETEPVNSLDNAIKVIGLYEQCGLGEDGVLKLVGLVKRSRMIELINGKWFWIDLDGIEIGPFETKEKARKDADLCGWSYDESMSGGLYGGKPPRDIAKRRVK